MKALLIAFSFLLFIVLSVHPANAQAKIGNNVTTINANALLELETTNKGLLLPRIALSSTTSASPLSAHVQGMTVYNTGTAGDVTPGVYVNNGTSWVRLTTGVMDLRQVNYGSHISADAGTGGNGTTAGADHVVAIGLNAGSANNGGAYNVFLGSYSGSANTSGSNNTFLGYISGMANTTGGANSFVGNWAGVSNTTGSHNSFFGNYAGGLNTTGFSNTFVGVDAGTGNKAGYHNTAIGRSALNSNDGGNYNTALGTEAMKSANGGGSNVAAGFQSLLNMTSGSFNTAIGSYAALYTTTGSNNISLGKASGENITTGSNNIAIGSSTWLPSATGNSQLNIGNLIYGTALDGSAATVSSGNIGIGTKTPGARLHVNGGVNVSQATSTLSGGISNNTADNFDFNNGFSTVKVNHYGMTFAPTASDGETFISGYNAVDFFTNGGNRLHIAKSGNVGVGVYAPTAVMHLKAGTSGANTAPLKFSTGANLSTPEDGAVEYDGSNYYVTSGTTRYMLAKTIRATITYDFSPSVAQSSNDQPFTVAGVAPGDFVIVNAGSTPGNSCYTAYVSAANTVNIRFNNYSTGTIDPPSTDFQVVVVKF